MKKMKKLISVLLTLVMVIAMAAPAFAAAEMDAPAEKQNGKITITNPSVGDTYSVYRIFDLESYNPEKTAYSYKVNEDWAEFFKDGGKGLDYVTISDTGYVEWKADANAAEFAKDALAYAKSNEIPTEGEPKEAKEEDATGLVFENLPLGYYLIDSTVGALCALNTTDNEVEVTEKNGKPTITKEVQEDSTEKWGGTNTAEIGEIVHYQATITVQPGAQNYVMHDKMSEGLTYQNVTGVTVNGIEVGKENYDVINPTADGCSFEISFTDAYCATLSAGTEIIVAYDAIVNEKAIIEGEGNPNEVTLTYGDSNETTASVTRTYVLKMDVKKYDAGKVEGDTESTENLDKVDTLTGAKFILSKTEFGEGGVPELNNGKPSDADKDKLVAFVLSGNTYRVATKEQVENGDVVYVIDAGNISILGLDDNTEYYLYEIEAPAGYNKLKEPVNFKLNVTYGEETEEIPEINVSSTISGKENQGTKAYVANNTGAELPETGGIGTTIFYIVGAILVIGAGIVLVTRKKMSHHE